MASKGLNEEVLAISQREPTLIASAKMKVAAGSVLVLASYNLSEDFSSPDAIRAEVRRDGLVLDHLRLHATGVPSFYTAHGTVTLVDEHPRNRKRHVYELFLQSELNSRTLPARGGHITVIPLGAAPRDLRDF